MFSKKQASNAFRWHNGCSRAAVRLGAAHNIILAAALSAFGCSDSPGAHRPTATKPETMQPVAVIDRSSPVTKERCEECHDKRETNPTRRRLEQFHGYLELEHGPRAFWCYSCHVEGNVARLRTPDGTTELDFDRAFELCGFCHGDKARDFRLNVHGLTTGSWNGPKERRSCTFCHDPHRPRFPMMAPLPPPAPPGATKRSE